MVRRNNNYAKLQNDYLFTQIAKKQSELLAQNPALKILNLGIGDVTEPIPQLVSERIQEKARCLAQKNGFTGYESSQGSLYLRKKIGKKIYNELIDPEEIFISDGAKSDIGRLQFLFGEGKRVAVQNPVYPAYVDSSVLSGKTGVYNPKADKYEGIIYMDCLPKQDFFPNLKLLPEVDIIYFCSPNNPTGAVSTKAELTQLVEIAHQRKAIIIFDAAYSFFIQDPSLPRSIYEVEGAREVAIEIGSFSKIASFTGLRLGWSVVPKELKFEGGEPVRNDWKALLDTTFNGASNVVQKGGVACLEEESMQTIKETIKIYLDNAKKLRKVFEQKGLKCYGGEHIPYLWVDFGKRDSWEVFQDLLENKHILTVPGVGFGTLGKNFIRFSAFAQTAQVDEAIERLL